MLTATGRFCKAVLFTVFTVAFLVFSVVNRQTIHVSLFPLPYSAEMPLFLLAMLCFAMGSVVGWALLRFKLSRSQRLLKSEHKRVLALQNEVGALHSEQQHLLPKA